MDSVFSRIQRLSSSTCDNEGSNQNRRSTSYQDKQGIAQKSIEGPSPSILAGPFHSVKDCSSVEEHKNCHSMTWSSQYSACNGCLFATSIYLFWLPKLLARVVISNRRASFFGFGSPGLWDSFPFSSSPICGLLCMYALVVHSLKVNEILLTLQKKKSTNQRASQWVPHNDKNINKV